MEAHGKRNVALAVAAGLLLLGGGGAFAASKLMSPQQESQAVINDAAKRLGVEPSKLSDALKGALEDRVDTAVASGEITKAQGDAMKKQIESGNMPLLFARHPHGGPGFGFGLEHRGLVHGLDAAAKAIGMTEAQLQTELQSGKTLAQIAKEHGKTADDVVNALVADAQTKLDAAVKAGRLTQAQADAMLKDLKSHIADMVNGTAPKGPPGPGFGPGFEHHGFMHGLDAAAKAIGITEAQLQTELQSGKSLAQIAKEHGKTADDVVSALVADAQSKLDAAVKAGRLTQAQADAMLKDLKSHITDLVNGTAPKGPWGDHDGDHGGMPGFRRFHGPNGGAFIGPPPTQGAVGAPVNVA